MKAKIISCDSHIHVGRFFESYYSPEYISLFIKTMNIEKALVSSTTTCEEDYSKVISEIHQLSKLSEGKVLPILWITPEMLKNNNLFYMLEAKIDWKCIKIHGLIHNWPHNGKLLQQVIDIAIEMQVPILVHSGGSKKCDAGSYSRVIKQHPNQIFILAHGRPVDEAMSVLKKSPNAHVDTAFMPLEDIKLLVDNGFEDKILFGTDFPITIHNEPDLSDTEWYQNRIAEIIDSIGIDKFKKISEENFNKMYC
jgi:uncharacterized protein